MGGRDDDSLDGGADDDLLLGDLAGVEFNASGTDGVGIASNIGDFPTTQITLEIMLNSTDTTGNTALVSYAVNDEDNEFTVQLGGGNITIYLGGTFIDTGIAEITVLDGTDTTLAITWDSSTCAVEVFVDGVSSYSGHACHGQHNRNWWHLCAWAGSGRS